MNIHLSPRFCSFFPAYSTCLDNSHMFRAIFHFGVAFDILSRRVTARAWKVGLFVPGIRRLDQITIAWTRRSRRGAEWAFRSNIGSPNCSLRALFNAVYRVEGNVTVSP